MRPELCPPSDATNAGPATVRGNIDDAVVLIVKIDGRIVEHTSGDLSRMWREMSAVDICGEHLGKLWPDEVATVIRERVRDSVRRRSVNRVDVTLPNDKGSRVHELTIIAHGRERALVICRDLTDKASLDHEVRELAFRDSMTGLPNQASFHKQLGHKLNEARLGGRNLSIMRVHLRGLDYINKTFGREAGSRLVGAIAKRLEEGVSAQAGLCRHLPQRCRVLLARTLGNEFSILVDGIVSGAALESLAQDVINQIAIPYTLSGSTIALDTCVGISRFPNDADDVETLLGNAGVALYDARKNSASAVVFFSGTAQVRSLSRMDIAQELRWALNNDQFSLLYHPCFDTATGQMTSAEAKLRWIHPLRGHVPLSEIRPIAQMNDLSRALGDWVMNQAWRDVAAIESSRSWYISLNLFARQSFAPELVEQARVLTRRHGLDPARVRFEIRATDFHRDLTASETTARALRDAGFEVVLDDCGLGAFSPQSILRTGIRQIKLSQKLVHRLPDNPGARQLTAGMIALCNALDVQVCATGVNTAQQRTCLREMGCERMQGTELSEPLDATQLASGLTNTLASVA